MLQNSKIVTFSIVLAVVMVQLDATIVNVSLPTLTDYFKVSAGTASWCILVYLLAQSCFMLFFGRLSDRNGVKKIFLFGYGTFTLFSVLCGLSPSIELLILFRFLQGIGGAAINVVIFAIVPKVYPKEITGTIFGIITTASAVGITLGTPIGGFLTEHFSWHWIFLINLPVGLLGMFLVYRNIKADEPRPEAVNEKLDILGTAVYSVAVICLLYALNQVDELGFGSPIILGLALFSILLFMFFFRYEKKVTSPLIDFSIFKNKALSLGLLSGVFAFMVLASSNFLMPFYLERVLQLDTDTTGLVLLGYSLPLIVIGPIAGGMSGRIGSKLPCTIGMLSAAAAFGLFAVFLGLANIYISIAVLLLIGIGYGFFNSPNHNFIKNSMPGNAVGILFGIEQTVFRFAMAFGVVILGSIYSSFLPSGSETVPAETYITAFRTSFIIEAVLCICALVLLIIANKRLKETAA